MNQPDPVVFVVDDDPAVRQSLGWLLESADLRTRTFASAEAFLDAYDPQQSGCLVLDLRLPGMSGMQLHDKLVSEQASLPMILISGHGKNAQVDDALARDGDVSFIEKPFDDEVLLELVRDCLERETPG